MIIVVQLPTTTKNPLTVREYLKTEAISRVCVTLKNNYIIIIFNGIHNIAFYYKYVQYNYTQL